MQPGYHVSANTKQQAKVSGHGGLTISFLDLFLGTSVKNKSDAYGANERSAPSVESTNTLALFAATPSSITLRIGAVG